MRSASASLRSFQQINLFLAFTQISHPSEICFIQGLGVCIVSLSARRLVSLAPVAPCGADGPWFRLAEIFATSALDKSVGARGVRICESHLTFGRLYYNLCLK